MNILGRIVRTTIYCRAPLAASGHRSIIPIAVSSSTNYQIQYASKSTKAGAGDSATAEGNAPAGTKKPKTAPKITLVGPDHSVSIMNLDEAQKISKRRDLKLVKVVDLDLKTQRPVYKLMTSAEYLEEDLKRREEKKRNKQEAAIKGDKLLTVSARITEHDLLSKIHNVQKWLNKQYEVRVIVSGDGDKAKQESVASAFENHVKDLGRIVQKRFRDNDMRFQILPILNSSNQETPHTATLKKPAQTGKNPGPEHQSVRAFHSASFVSAA
ncbi:AAEL007885-PA [Aedes aegypti]|uniref:AAEL007885-PA n=1 Tax=Aedes aegypti TaxID=7159 RepID=Q170L7_AEDAE|nr:AAEL007885-PA [Aedes aegypti]